MKHNTCLATFLLAFTMLWAAALPAFADDESNRSEFIYRSNLGRAEDIRLLIRQGVSPNQASSEGVPAICLAAGRIDPEGINVLQALLDNGANINARDPRGQTALHYAAKAGNTKAINFLMEHNIDAYALDNNGDVARTAAYKAGQNDAVKTIDDFVLRQTAEVTQQYRQRNRELAEMRNPKNAAQNDNPHETPPAPPVAAVAETPKEPAPPENAPKPVEAAKPAEPAKPEPLKESAPPAAKEIPAEEKAPSATEKPTPPPADQPAQAEEKPAAKDATEETGSEDAGETTDDGGNNDGSTANADENPETPAEQASSDDAAAQAAADAEEERKRLQEENDRKQEETQQVIYDMAFNVCAFQYWSYCHSVGQTMDIDKEEVLIAIESSKTEAERLKHSLLNDYSIASSNVEGISSSVQKRIYAELNNMASNRDRHEKGVGKRDDMQERCEFLARQWGSKNAVKHSDNSDDAGGSAGKGGKSRQGVGKGGKSKGGKSKGGKGGKGGKGKSKGGKSKKAGSKKGRR